ncbi:MAG TPA: tripartite tricarboxylate transporter substrate binding protein [Burkholderiales bacterium]|jgi:tripartite-type tricarboxylate transporter receptor subunit TctC|nr:tripartite tricarboxylate transporter substrate binding protein [Burkholderiales bacterium]
MPSPIRIAALALAALLPAASFAQAWPSHPITMIVPFAAGGTTDIVARAMALELGKTFNTSVVVDNRAGAGGTLGAGIAAHATPDGYTIFMSTVAHAIAPSLYGPKRLNYDFERDLAPITEVSSLPNLLLVNNSVPVKNEKELIAYLKASPGKFSYGSAGNGSIEHLSGALFASLAGVQMIHVPYKGGAPMMTDLISGTIQMAIETSGSAAPQVRSGKVRALGISTAKRSAAFPDVPTMQEAGLPGYEVTTWYGLLAPRGTPPEIITKLYNASAAILKTPDMKKRLEDIGADPGGMPPAEFAAFIKTETVKWAKVVKESGATVE